MDWRSDPAHTRAEKDVFWLMMALTSRLSGVGSGLGMRELWLPGVPQLKVMQMGGWFGSFPWRGISLCPRAGEVTDGGTVIKREDAFQSSVGLVGLEWIG